MSLNRFKVKYSNPPSALLLWAALFFFFAGLFVPATAFSTQAAIREDTQDVSYWLAKMDQALKRLSYEGTFIYMRGIQLETVHVVHQFNEGIEKEKLSSLNGAPREIIREGDSLVCYHNTDVLHDEHHRVPMGPLTHGFVADLNRNQSLYRVELFGEGRVAGRDAIQLRISPKNNDRHGYVLFLDRETGLLLQSNLVSRGRVLELFQFTNISMQEPIASSAFERTFSLNSANHALHVVDDQRGNYSNAPPPAINVPWVPSGFRQVKSRQANSLRFSDGMASVTIFIEPANAKQVELATNIGGTVVISRKLKDSIHQITLVGELPIKTAQKIAESIKPVIY